MQLLERMSDNCSSPAKSFDEQNWCIHALCPLIMTVVKRKERKQDAERIVTVTVDSSDDDGSSD